MLQMAVSGSLNEDLSINGDSLKTNIENTLGNNDFEFIDNGDGSFKVKINSSDRLYYIEENGNIISPENMIEIASAEELKTFRDEVNSGNSYEGWYIYLTNNITLDINEQWEPIGLYLNENTNPYDETNLPFSGVFDGNGHEVEGIYINATDKAYGLFGLIDDGKVLNLSIGENCDITGGKATAGIAGYICGNSIINNCSNYSNISGDFSGGVVGYSSGSKIYYCDNYGNIEGNYLTGGVIGGCGNHEKSLVYNCHNSGNIVCTTYWAGGIVGYFANESKLSNCYNDGKVEGGYYVGGISGNMGDKCILENSYNSGTIYSTSFSSAQASCTGGIIGVNDNSTVINVYNIGSVSGLYKYIGGIAGVNRGILENAYNIGNIDGESFGGIVGNNEIYNDSIGIIRNSYCLDNYPLYGNNLSTISLECITLDETQLKLITTTLGSAFKIDIENINNGYPILGWQ